MTDKTSSLLLTISKNIRAIKEREEITISEIADWMMIYGVEASESTLRNYFSGEPKDMTISKLYALAKVLRVSLDWLVTDHD